MNSRPQVTPARPLRILIAHNRYQIGGGEDTAMAYDVDLLRNAGHKVFEAVISNDEIRTVKDKFQAAVRVAHNSDGVHRITEALQQCRPDILHVHNFFPLFSPAIYRAARQMGIGVVQTLHNYRTVCAGAMLMRDGKPCHKCIDGTPYWGAVHRCYRDSFAGSLPLAHMIDHHRRRGTWQADVDRYIVLSEFARRTFVSAGFPEERIVVKHNTAEDSGEPAWQNRDGIVYVGRLSEEKGVRHLLQAAHLTTAQIDIIGEGPLEADLKVGAPNNVRFLGVKTRREVQERLAKARALVLPSICYEGFPMTLAESFSAGTPVIASHLGSLVELIEDGVTGLHVRPGNAKDLASAITQVAASNRIDQMGIAARRTYKTRFTESKALAILESTYNEVLAMRLVSESGQAFGPVKR